MGTGEYFFSVESVSEIIFLPEVQVYTSHSLSLSPTKILRNFTKSSREKPCNCDFRLIFLAANLYYFVIQCFRCPSIFLPIQSACSINKIIFLSWSCTLSMIMFIDTALSPSYCFGLSPRRNSFRFKSDQISFY